MKMETGKNYWWEVYAVPTYGRMMMIRDHFHYKTTRVEDHSRKGIWRNGSFTLAEVELMKWLLYEIFVYEGREFIESENVGGQTLTTAYINKRLKQIINEEL